MVAVESRADDIQPPGVMIINDYDEEGGHTARSRRVIKPFDCAKKFPEIPQCQMMSELEKGLWMQPHHCDEESRAHELSYGCFCADSHFADDAVEELLVIAEHM